MERDDDPFPGEPRRAGAAQHLERDRGRPQQLAAVAPEEVDCAVVLHLLAARAGQPDPRVLQRLRCASASANVSTRPTPDALSLAPAVKGVRSAWMHIASSSTAATALGTVSGQIHGQPVNAPRR